MKQKATIIVVISACLAGLSGVLIKMMSSMEVTSIAGLRMTLPALGIGLYLKYSGVKIFRQKSPKMLLASGLNAFRLYFYFIAYIYTSVGSAAILFYCFPMFVALMGYFFLGEKLSKRQWFFLFLAFIGLVISYSHLSFSFENNDFIGMSSALVAGVVYASTVIIFKSESQNYNSNEIVFYQNILGMFVFLPFFVNGYSDVSMHDLGICILYTFVTGFVVFKLFFIGLKYLEASIASSIMYLEVASAIILSYLILGETLNANMVVGGLIIIISSFMISRDKNIS